MRWEAEASVVNEHMTCPSAFMLSITQRSKSNIHKSIKLAARSNWIKKVQDYCSKALH